jgi:uncharacterized protein YihD (DUF1040 family)
LHDADEPLPERTTPSPPPSLYLPRRSSLTHAALELNLDEEMLRQLAEANDGVPVEIVKVMASKPSSMESAAPMEGKLPYKLMYACIDEARDSCSVMTRIAAANSAAAAAGTRHQRPGGSPERPVHQRGGGRALGKDLLVQQVGPGQPQACTLYALFTVRRCWVLNEMAHLLQQIHKSEAVEYVMDILQALASDADLTVRQTFAENMDDILSYYYVNCAPEPGITADTRLPGMLPPNAFPTSVHQLILDPAMQVATAARDGVVRLCSRTAIEPGVMDREVYHAIVLGLLTASCDVIGRPETSFLNAYFILCADDCLVGGHPSRRDRSRVVR